MASERDIDSALSFLTGRPPANGASAAAAIRPRAASRGVSDARTAIESHPWMADAGICGLGLAERITAGKQLAEIALKVYVVRKLPGGRCSQPIPKEISLDGLPPIPVDVEETGRFELHAGSSAKRPAMPGSSVGRAGDNRWFGTFGMVALKRGKPEPWYLVSSSHVIANSGLAAVGDPIVQPAAIAGGAAPADAIGKLSEWVPFEFSTTSFDNLVDAAIADLDPGAATAAIMQLGVPTGVSTDLARGMDVQKVGSGTSFSIARIKDIHLRMPASYPTANGTLARAGFTDQVMTTFYAGQGDSGAPVLNMKKEVVGLHFAGSATFSVFNKIQNVLNAMELDLVTAATGGGGASESECQIALDQHASTLTKLPNVVGLGVVPANGPKGEMAVAVYVNRKVEAGELDAAERVPSRLSSVRDGKETGIATRVIEVGDLTPNAPSSP